jgi:hypothetical protein
MVPAREFVLLTAGVSVAIFGLLLVGVGGMDSPSGFLTFEKKTYVSIGPDTESKVSRFGFGQFLTIGETAEIDVELMNQGSVPMNANYTVEVYNRSNVLLYRYPGPTVTLQPGEFASRTVRHAPHETGTYIVRLRARMGTTLHQTGKFLVVSDESQNDTQTITLVRKQINWIDPPPLPGDDEEEETLSRSWRVDSPREVVMQDGGRTLVPIRITNSGEASIRQVRISLSSSENITVDYSPKMMFEIPSNETKSFLVDVSARNGTLEDQELRYKLTTPHFARTETITFSISPTTSLRQLRQEVENLEGLMIQLRAEINATARRGTDVGKARTLALEAQGSIADARETLEAEDIRGTRQDIRTAREDIDAAFQALFEARSQPEPVKAPLVRPVYLLLVFSVLIAVILVSIYYYLREKHERRPKLLREME